MRRLIIESPFAGERTRNILYGRAACAHSLSLGDAPFASHLLYTQPGILDDDKEDERALGIAAGFLWGAIADATALYVDLGVSDGMKFGFRDARRRHRRLELRSLASDLSLAAGYDEHLDDLLAKAASVFGNGDSAAYFREQAAIENQFTATAATLDRIEAARNEIERGAYPKERRFRL